MVSILVVEADTDIAEQYQQAFSQCDTHFAEDALSAMELLRQQQPDLVITDYHLPKGSAARFLTFMHLHPQLWKVPVLCVSADPLVRHKAETLAISAFLSKPADTQKLLSTAYKLLIKDRRLPNPQLQAALDEYVTAYQTLYARLPDLGWMGGNVVIDRRNFDEPRLRAETNLLCRAMQRNAQTGTVSHLLEKLAIRQ
jgi:CheY-like chemotaxis protein